MKPHQEVVYLFGAGASHACAKAVGSSHGILMHDLSRDLVGKVEALVRDKYHEDASLRALVNEVVNESADYEHIITFLDESSSFLHRSFAEDLRHAFEQALRDKLDSIEVELGVKPTSLYDALFDMYKVKGLGEIIRGVITLNYDDYIETSISRMGYPAPNLGIMVDGWEWSGDSILLLKLHGSFDWSDGWPVSKYEHGECLWIPPGIQKAKSRYPFNVLWGQARELLDCDILRIIGCNLGANDWDLVSLLFSTRHVNANGRRYIVEVIDSPERAQQLRRAHPYLDARSILEIEPVGPQLVSEFAGGPPRPFSILEPREQQALVHAMGHNNWFRLWLKVMAESLFTDLGSVDTEAGALKALLEGY